MLQPGTILLEKYRVERVLGQGGMGLVVAVQHVHLGELFAIKTMLPQALESPEATGRFLREARACAKLKGEHVARVHDVGNLPDGAPYMLMEYLEGRDLGHMLAERRNLPVPEAVEYVLQACEAIAEAHALGIIHRDLKPSNLFLIHRPNGTPCIKVLDFGISKEIGHSTKADAKLTQTGSMLGSPMYMSPEQMTDVKNADVRTDIWSLGVILYELVVGKNPFEAQAIPNVVSKVLLSHPEPPSAHVPGIPAELDAVVLRCLNKSPELRYGSIQELVTALEPFAGFVVATASRRAEVSRSMSRAALLPRLVTAETLPGKTVEPLLPVDPTLPGLSNLSHLEVAQTMPGVVVDDRAAPREVSLVPAAAQSTVVMTPFPPPKPVGLTGDGPSIQSPFVLPDVLSTSQPSPAVGRRKKLVGVGMAIGIVALLIAMGVAFSMRTSSVETAGDSLSSSSATTVAKTVAGANSQLPVPQEAPAPTQLPMVEPAKPSSSAEIASGSPTSAQSVAKSATSPLPIPKTTSRPTPTSTSTQTKRKTVPVRGYDD